MNFLEAIVARKLEDSLRLFEPGVAEAFKAEIARRPAPVSLKAALDGAAGPAIIAEVKRASPSKGEFAMHWDPVELAQIYQDQWRRGDLGPDGTPLFQRRSGVYPPDAPGDPPPHFAQGFYPGADTGL